MAGMWFNGVMGSFTPYSAFNGWNSNSNQTLPPNIDGGRSMMTSNTHNLDNPKNNTESITQQSPSLTNIANSLNKTAKNSDDIKHYSGNESSNPGNLGNSLFQPHMNKVQTTDKTRPINGGNDEKA